MRRSKLTVVLRKIGNGRGILLSKSICDVMGVDIDDRFTLDIVDDRIILIPVMRDGDG